MTDLGLWVDCSQCSYEDLGSDEEEEEMEGALSPPICPLPSHIRSLGGGGGGRGNQGDLSILPVRWFEFCPV